MKAKLVFFKMVVVSLLIPQLASSEPPAGWSKPQPKGQTHAVVPMQGASQKTEQKIRNSGQPFTEIQCFMNYHFSISGFHWVGSSKPKWKNGTIHENTIVAGPAEHQFDLFSEKAPTLCRGLQSRWSKDCESQSKSYGESSGKEAPKKADCRRGFVPDAENGNSYLANGFIEVKNDSWCHCILSEKSVDSLGCEKTRIITSQTESM